MAVKLELTSVGVATTSGAGSHSSSLLHFLRTLFPATYCRRISIRMNANTDVFARGMWTAVNQRGELWAGWLVANAANARPHLLVHTQKAAIWGSGSLFGCGEIASNEIAACVE